MTPRNVRVDLQQRSDRHRPEKLPLVLPYSGAGPFKVSAVFNLPHLLRHRSMHLRIHEAGITGRVGQDSGQIW